MKRFHESGGEDVGGDGGGWGGGGEEEGRGRCSPRWSRAPSYWGVRELSSFRFGLPEGTQFKDAAGARVRALGGGGCAVARGGDIVCYVSRRYVCKTKSEFVTA